VFIPGLSESSGDDVEEGEVRDNEAPAARAATLAGRTPAGPPACRRSVVYLLMTQTCLLVPGCTHSLIRGEATISS